MASDDYEIMPHKEIAGLKDELKKLKGRSLRKTSRLDAESMDNLAASIQELMTLFKEASKDLKNEENEEAHILQKLTEATDMMNTLADQNEKLAEGIVTVAEMIKDHMPRAREIPKRSSTVLGVPVLGEAPKQPPPQMSAPEPMIPATPSAPPRSAFPDLNTPPTDMFAPPPGMPQSAPPTSPPGMPPPITPPPSMSPGMPPPSAPVGPPDSMDSMPPPPAPPPSDLPPPPQDKKGFLDRFK